MRKHLRREITASKPEIAAWFAAKPPHGPELPGDRKLSWPKALGNTAEEGVFDKLKDGKVYFRGGPESIYSGTPIGDYNPMIESQTAAGRLNPDAVAVRLLVCAGLEKWGMGCELVKLITRGFPLAVRESSGRFHLAHAESCAAAEMSRPRRTA